MSTILNWMSLLIGVVGVVLAFYYANRKKRPCQLKYIPGEFFNIYETLVSDKFNLEIKYADTPINNSIYYINGKLVVKGYDIKTESNEITIELPEGCKWIDLSIEPSPMDINAKLKEDTKLSEKAIITFKKFRTDEHINISGIIEGQHLPLETISDFHKKIHFESRIDDTEKKIIIDEASLRKDLLIAFF